MKEVKLSPEQREKLHNWLMEMRPSRMSFPGPIQITILA